MSQTGLPQSLLRSVTDQAPMGILVVAESGVIQYCNETLGDYLGMEAAGVTGHPESVVFDQFEGTRAGPNVHHISLLPQIRRPQRWLRSERIMFPVQGEKGLQSVEVIYFHDVTDMHRMQTEVESLHQQLEDTVPNDSVTGLMNRRTLFQALEPQVSRSRRYHNPLSLIVMTVTEFHCEPRNVSTTRDQMLITISNFLRDQVRWVDIIGRTGEQEFTLVLPETNAADAEKLASKLQNRLASVEMMENSSAKLCINLHIGITSWRKGDDTRLLLQRVYRALDTAMESPNSKMASL